MGISLTGNAEIDQQHAILESMVGELARFCEEVASDPSTSCDRCSAKKRQGCTATLTSITSELGAFLVGHATYEERLMELLPRTAKCRAHIKGHKAAHARISKQLRKFSLQLDKQCPRAASFELLGIVENWTGEHTFLFDAHLASQLGSVAFSEIDFDAELVAILDEHVFHNRPTTLKPAPGNKLALPRKKLEVRGRFELLSPAQREVFWLVVNGSKSSEIAARLGISINTVKSHRAAIFQKMEVRSVLDLLKKTDVLRQNPRR